MSLNMMSSQLILQATSKSIICIKCKYANKIYYIHPEMQQYLTL